MTLADEHLNVEAVLALSGARVDVAGALIALLRSNAIIDPAVRSKIADALEGTQLVGCPQLSVTGIGRGHATPAGLARFRRHVEIAEDVERQIIRGSTRQVAEQTAAANFHIGEDLCHKAVTGFRKMEKWLAQTHREAPLGCPPNLWLQVRQAEYLFSVGPLVR